MQKLIPLLLLCASVLAPRESLAAAMATPSFGTNTSTGIITPDVATGFVRIDHYRTYGGQGDLRICLPDSFRCEDKWVSPQQYLKAVAPKAQYVGFQLMQSRSGEQLYLFYKNPR